MAENSGRRIGCLVGCIALALLGAGGVVVVAAGGVLLAGGAGAASYMVLRRDATPMPVPADAWEVPEHPVPVVAVPGPVVDGTPAADGSNQADMTGTEGTEGTEGGADAEGTEGTEGTEGADVAPVPESSGTAETTPSPSPAPVPTTTPAPTPKPSPAPSPSPSPTPKPAPTPSPVTSASGGKVTVEGAATVVLIGGDGSRTTLPASVPSGSYTMEATFSDGVPVNVGKVTVEEGGSHVVRCNENMGICRGS